MHFHVCLREENTTCPSPVHLYLIAVAKLSFCGWWNLPPRSGEFALYAAESYNTHRLAFSSAAAVGKKISQDSAMGSRSRDRSPHFGQDMPKRAARAGAAQADLAGAEGHDSVHEQQARHSLLTSSKAILGPYVGVRRGSPEISGVYHVLSGPQLSSVFLSDDNIRGPLVS